MSKAKFKHRAIPVGEDKFVSLCESCAFMPSGKVPLSNHEVGSGAQEKPHMYCLKKAFFPAINYSNDGKPFYDVAKCDGWELFEEIAKKKQNTHPEITRPNE